MDDLKTIIEFSYNLLQTPIQFGSITLTPIGIYIGLFSLSITISFIRKLFD